MQIDNLVASPNRPLATVSWNVDAGDDEGRSHSWRIEAKGRSLMKLPADTSVQDAIASAQKLIEGQDVLALVQGRDSVLRLFKTVVAGATSGNMNGQAVAAYMIPWTRAEHYRVYPKDVALRALISSRTAMTL